MFENVLMPMSLSGCRAVSAATARSRRSTGWGSDIGATSCRARCRAANVSASRSHGPSWSGPRLLLADEPTGSLDQRTSGAEVMDLFEELNAGGLTLAIITHDQAIADRATRSVRISDGRLSEAA